MTKIDRKALEADFEASYKPIMKRLYIKYGRRGYSSSIIRQVCLQWMMYHNSQSIIGLLTKRNKRRNNLHAVKIIENTNNVKEELDNFVKNL